MSEDRPILVGRFPEDAFGHDLDAVSDGESIYIGGIMQHIEAAAEAIVRHKSVEKGAFQPVKLPDYLPTKPL